MIGLIRLLNIYVWLDWLMNGFICWLMIFYFIVVDSLRLVLFETDGSGGDPSEEIGIRQRQGQSFARHFRRLPQSRLQGNHCRSITSQSIAGTGFVSRCIVRWKQMRSAWLVSDWNRVRQPPIRLVAEPTGSEPAIDFNLHFKWWNWTLKEGNDD